MKRKLEEAVTTLKRPSVDEEYEELIEQGILQLVARRGETKSC